MYRGALDEATAQTLTTRSASTTAPTKRPIPNIAFLGGGILSGWEGWLVWCKKDHEGKKRMSDEEVYPIRDEVLRGFSPPAVNPNYEEDRNREAADLAKATFIDQTVYAVCADLALPMHAMFTGIFLDTSETDVFWPENRASGDESAFNMAKLAFMAKITPKGANVQVGNSEFSGFIVTPRET